jgi:hypothetical protein
MLCGGDSEHGRMTFGQVLLHRRHCCGDGVAWLGVKRRVQRVTKRELSVGAYGFLWMSFVTQSVLNLGEAAIIIILVCVSLSVQIFDR